jgi:hypothetical protein
MKNAKATDDMANHFVYYFGLFLLPILASTLVSHFGLHFPHAKIIWERIQKAHEIARKNLARSAKRRKDFYDIKSKLTLYKKADKVWVRNENRKGNLDSSPNWFVHRKDRILSLRQCFC